MRLMCARKCRPDSLSPTRRTLSATLASAVLLLGHSLPAVADDGPVFLVSHLELRFADPDLSMPDAALPVEVELRQTGQGLARLEKSADGDQPAPSSKATAISIGSDPAAVPYRLHASGLGAVLEAVLVALRQDGLVGVYVAPDPEDIDATEEIDRRAPGTTGLRVVVTVGRVRSLRSVALGDRVEETWQIDNPLHRRIRNRSPIQPTDALGEGQTDLLRKDELEAYLFRLNRHPGRNVAAALSATEDGGIALDYRVAESRPWILYAQTSDTGSARTNAWQTTVGAVHNQLTNSDDIFNLRYTNAGGDDLHAIRGSYQAPWFGEERPSWWKTSGQEPGWLSWIDRDHLPWWGSDRLRWEISGGWSLFRATDVNLTDDIEGEDWDLGLQVSYNVFQHRALFVDLVASTRLRNVSHRNISLSSSDTISELFLLPQVGLELERNTETSALSASLLYERNVLPVEKANASRLGRQNVDPRYQILHYDLGLSFFLEPLLRPGEWRNPATPNSSTLAHEIAIGLRGQYAFNDRLIPQVSQVAGGFLSVRGYPQSAAVGDSVYLGSLEYRFHLPRSLPVARNPLRVPGLGNFRVAPQQVYGRPDWDLIVRGFVDAGWTVRNKASSVVGERDNKLLGAGLGLELRVRHNLTLRADWARALHGIASSSSAGTSAGDDEFHFLVNLVY